ncbi:ethylene-responsive transcription factor ERF117-like [Lotus japonicus]|uniref:ethylene-responsive transcription factor ERF117-like n=1 Tax=Lotus japonicus TaxID=34305 RepID=UPI00258B27A0|nr:ethylene-responsive transcription factor ERF117-like [Lotus japonicus]
MKGKTLKRGLKCKGKEKVSMKEVNDDGSKWIVEKILVPTKSCVENCPPPQQDVDMDCRKVVDVVPIPCSSKRKKEKTSKFEGVRRRPSGNFAAEIRGVKLWLGTFKNELNVAKAYENKKKELQHERLLASASDDTNKSSKGGNVSGP